jgi:hypothetical protein
MLPALLHASSVSSLRCELFKLGLLDLLAEYFAWRLHNFVAADSNQSVEDILLQISEIFVHFLNDDSIDAQRQPSFIQFQRVLLRYMLNADTGVIEEELLLDLQDLLCTMVMQSREFGTSPETNSDLYLIMQKYKLSRLEEALKCK